MGKCRKRKKKARQEYMTMFIGQQIVHFIFYFIIVPFEKRETRMHDHVHRPTGYLFEIFVIVPFEKRETRIHT